MEMGTSNKQAYTATKWEIYIIAWWHTGFDERADEHV